MQRSSSTRQRAIGRRITTLLDESFVVVGTEEEQAGDDSK